MGHAIQLYDKVHVRWTLWQTGIGELGWCNYVGWNVANFRCWQNVTWPSERYRGQCTNCAGAPQLCVKLHLYLHIKSIDNKLC